MATPSDAPEVLTHGRPRRRLLPVDEACAELGGASRNTFYRLVARGDLALVKIGRRSFVTADEMDRYVASLQEQEPSDLTPAKALRRRPATS